MATWVAIMVVFQIIVNLIVSFVLVMITGVIASVANVIEITTTKELSAKEALKTTTPLRLAQGFLEITIVDQIATIALAMITHVITSAANVIEIATTRTMEIIVAFVIVKIVDVITNAASALTITIMEMSDVQQMDEDAYFLSDTKEIHTIAAQE